MPEPLKVFERRSSEHLAGCVSILMTVGVAAAVVGALLVLFHLVVLEGEKLWVHLSADAAALLVVATLAGGLTARQFKRGRERVAFFENHVDVNWSPTRWAEIESVRTLDGRVTMKDVAGRETLLPDVATPGELLAWFKTRLPPDRILGC